MKIKLSLFILCVMFWVYGTAQDITYNSFCPFDNIADTNQVTWGLRWGSINLSQPQPQKGLAVYEKKAYEEFPERVGIGNLIMDFRTRFARDTVFGVGHDALASLNISLLRSRMFVGYQYNRLQWYCTGKFGYQVYRVIGGEFKNGSRTFSRNLPLAGFEFGLTPQFWGCFFQFRAMAEYDFGHFGWYGSAVTTVKVFSSVCGRLDIGCQYDGIWGYGPFASAQYKNILIYFSSFLDQLPIQETRFPEQRIGMEKGFAVGLQLSFK